MDSQASTNIIVVHGAFVGQIMPFREILSLSLSLSHSLTSQHSEKAPTTALGLEMMFLNFARRGLWKSSIAAKLVV